MTRQSTIPAFAAALALQFACYCAPSPAVEGGACEKAEDCAEGFFCLGRVCRQEPGARHEAGGNDVGGPFDGGPDAETFDAGPIPEDCETSCQVLGGDCSTCICCAPLFCDGEKCVTCLGIDKECADDAECCPSSDPLKGAWCGFEGRCAECSLADGPCAADYDCCPPANGERALICHSHVRCVPMCERDADCQTGETCMPGGECVPIPCSSDAECSGGEHCCSGECKPDCGYGPPEACAITTPGGVIFKDKKRALHAIAWKGDAKSGAQLVPWTLFAWQSSNPEAVAVDSRTGELIGGSVEGATEISATSGELDCGTVAVTNYLPMPPATGTVRVLVFDEETGRPVQGANVIVDSIPPVKTDAAGLALLTSPPADVHVFHNDYDWISLVGLDLDDFVVHLSPKPGELAGGYTGEFDFDPTRHKSITVGIAGTSISGDLPDFAFATLLGHTILTYVRVPQTAHIAQPVDPWWPVPAALTLSTPGLGVSELKDRYMTQGRAGFRTAWGVGGGLPLKSFTKIIQRSAEVMATPPNDNVGSGIAWAWLSPDLSDNWHSVSSLFEVVAIPKIPTPTNYDGGTPLVDASTMADYEHFPKLDHVLTQRANRRTVATLPDLPSVQGRCLGMLFAIVGTTIPGMGLTPLGMASAQDTFAPDENPPNCRVSPPPDDPAEPSEGQLSFWTSPDHGGTEANTHATVVVCEGSKNRGEGAAAGVVARHSGVPANIDLSVPGFPAFAEGGVFTDPTRTINGVVSQLPDKAYVEYRLKGSSGNWRVLTAGSASEIVLPQVPPGQLDRSAGAGMTVYSIRTTGVSLADLVSPAGDQHLNDLGDVLDGFSRLPCRRKIAPDDPDYASKCVPDAGPPAEACNPACEVR